MAREPRAVLCLLMLALLGHAARFLIGRRDAPPGELLGVSSIGAADPAAHRARSLRVARPLLPDEKIDLNRADAEEIARLPRVGMSLAKRIVADRTARGAYRSPADLDRVPGVGPGLLATLDGKVTFGGAGAPNPPRDAGAKLGMSSSYGAGGEGGQRPPVDLNSASLADLETLPEIGPARARAIMAYRREAGPFAAVSDLDRVPGISRSLAARLARYVTIGGGR